MKEWTYEEFFGDTNYDFEIDNPDTASVVLRNLYRPKYKKREENKKQKDTSLYKDLYNMLPKEYQFVINRAIEDFIPEEVREQHFGEYLEHMFDSLHNCWGEKEEITTYKLARYLDIKQKCANKRESLKDKKECPEDEQKDTGKLQGWENIRSKLESFTKKKKTVDSSFILQMDICEMLSFDAEILDCGQGIKYDIDHDRVKELLEESGKNPAEYYKEILDKWVECSNCEWKRRGCEFSEKYKETYKFDKRRLGEAITKLLNVEESEIIKETYIILEPDEFPFDEYYRKLSKENQLHINNLIKNLYMALNMQPK